MVAKHRHQRLGRDVQRRTLAGRLQDDMGPTGHRRDHVHLQRLRPDCTVLHSARNAARDRASVPPSPAPAALSPSDRYLLGFEGDTAIVLYFPLADYLAADPLPVLMAVATLLEQPVAAAEAQAIVGGRRSRPMPRTRLRRSTTATAYRAAPRRVTVGARQRDGGCAPLAVGATGEQSPAPAPRPTAARRRIAQPPRLIRS